MTIVCTVTHPDLGPCIVTVPHGGPTMPHEYLRAEIAALGPEPRNPVARAEWRADVRRVRIAAARAEHALEHAYCKTTRGPREVYQRTCKDPCHRSRKVES